MKIISAEVVNFRNLETQTINLSPNLNVIFGKNAQGKTNFIEALYFCAVSKSFKTSKEKELINFANGERKPFFKINLLIQKKYTKSKIEIKVFAQGKKSVLINGVPIKKISQLFGELNCVFFSPDELKLIKEAPMDRRKFMDIDISQVSKNYFNLLLRYDKILLSRNKLLKSNSSALREQLEIYTQSLCDVGSKIIKARVNFLEKLTPFAKLSHAYLTDSKESLEIFYSGINKPTLEEIKNEMKTELDKNLEKDIEMGFTSVGPHRDDIKILLGGVDVKTYGSQGQQRTCALSLKLAELEIIKNECGEMPVLLLDDVLSELDESRRKKLISFTSKAQTILSCNEYEGKLNSQGSFFIKVESGKLTKI